MKLKIGGGGVGTRGISSRFSIAWWFCRFLARRRRWCSLSGGRRSKWRRLWREEEVRRPRGDTGKQGAGASTCVALQFLHDLLRLQVPDVHHVVLGARHDPLQDTGLASRTKNRPTTCGGGAYLPAGDGEIGKYAVLLVLMARVCFQALARSERNNLETFPVIE